MMMKPDMPTVALHSCPLNLPRNRVGASGSDETARADKADPPQVKDVVTIAAKCDHIAFGFGGES
jgi:hypothetical protein